MYAAVRVRAARTATSRYYLYPVLVRGFSVVFSAAAEGIPLLPPVCRKGHEERIGRQTDIRQEVSRATCVSEGL